MNSLSSNIRSERARATVALACSVLLVTILAAAPQSQRSAAYTIYTADGTHTLPVRTIGRTEFVSLGLLADWFDLSVTEDRVLDGLTIAVRDQRIVVIPGQRFVSIGGRVDSMSGDVQRDGDDYLVPLDFLSRALARALGQPFDIRRARRVIVVGSVRVPEITVRFSRSGSAGRLRLTIEPATPHRVSLQDRRLLIRFDAMALDVDPFSNADPAFVTGASIDGSMLVVELGPSVATFDASTGPGETRLTIDLLPPVSTAPDIPTRGRRGPEPGRTVVDLGNPDILRTVVIDPGHGGEDVGTRGPDGTLEKDVTLTIARRLKTTIERQLGVRVLLTRNSDVNIPIDSRTALANNNKAGLYLSLHANASTARGVRGAEVWTLDLAEYRDRASGAGGRGTAVALVGGGSRLIEAVPWDLAQIPFVGRSSTVGRILLRQLADADVPLRSRSVQEIPLRGLVGANMPAVLLEMGFLTNTRDARALTSGDTADNIVDAIARTITAIRSGVPSRGPGGP
jgi:N-acetylmuramoyl-L-alanine amidase